MKLSDMFVKSIDRPINGVIKVMQTDDENRQQELEEYVITRELRKHFSSFYDHYEQSVDGLTDKMGVWISGFFGSGKSHFLKILSYLLANEEVGGKRAIEYFDDKANLETLSYETMRRVSQVPTEVILFNIDAKSPMGKDESAILRVFTKVFYEHCGYYGDDMKVASFERFLDRQGKLEAFKEAFLAINMEEWTVNREAFAFWEDDIVEALTQVTDISEQAARNWFNGEETAELSIDRFAREVQEYVQSKGDNFHLVFLVDEIGQYIGDHSGLMLNLQTVVEELGSKCNGKVWVIVTSQEDIDSVTHVKGNDFSKIQGRFNTRLSLSSASVDEVIKRRILAKTDAASDLLQLMYRQHQAAMRNLFIFAQGTVSDLKGYSSEGEFVEAYPFVPYQFKLLQDVLVQVRKHGSSGKHLSGGERSMLSAFQEAAQKFKEKDETHFVPFYAFYDTVHTFLDGAVRRVIDRADRAAQAGDGLKAQDVDILKLLFLIRYVEGVPANIENLSTLMITSLRADKIAMRQQLQESLDRLVYENYVSRNGETYLFLTDEEQDINREIRQTMVDANEVIHMIGQMVFADIYPGGKYRYHNRYDFSYDRMVDHAVVGQPGSDIKLRLITLASEISENDADAHFILQSRAGNEAIIHLSAKNDYYHELVEVKRIEKYIKQRNVAQLPETIRKIILSKQSEAKDREKTAMLLLKEAIVKGNFYIAGDRCTVRTSNAKEALDEALAMLVESVYSKLNYVDTFAQSDADLQRILNSSETQEMMMGVSVPNNRAIEEMDQYLTVRARQNMQVTMADMQKRYQAAPYGWREIDIAAVAAAMLRAQKIQLVYNSAPLMPADRKIPDCLRKRTDTERTIVRQKVSVSEEMLKAARKLAIELFSTMDIKSDEDNLCGQIASLLGDLKKKNDQILNHYHTTVQYPGKKVVDDGKRIMEHILLYTGDHTAFLKAFLDAEDDLLDWSEDFREVSFFFANQKTIFDNAWQLCEKLQQERHYFADEQEALASGRTIADILRMEKPYRRIVEIPTYTQKIDGAYKRINEERLARVQDVLVQARGDIHTLAADHPELTDMVRRADDELDRRRQAALEATSPTLLDAAITQIITYKDGVCQRMEQLLTPVQPEPHQRICTLRRYDVLPQQKLSSEADIDRYVAALKDRLMEALKDHDAVQLN
ncbi:MAG: BREX system P-loop protein BrxC [Clostridia bacterium]|nr:BREX system P-loop protein BrxC [Clostridia bacterium]